MINLESLVIISILSGSFGIASSDFMINLYGKTFNKQLPKPFSCSFCMAFWGGLILALSYDMNTFDCIYIGCLGSITSTLISKLIHE